eukprot:CAMPEP_0204630388 /NCGR_PEP_ID=MMETSP0717-20131115/20309_1 /ASSEMBLY_ACC=CAM_ASM_000666 /TAXON_ID=230516 /ORGANISM="Chaetoceros curvisetus" /LENGTH=51 /DNA_ID=CAMNT_0051647603 /DNA_START=75 /DNA_END=230 /DNA_ORIENTATION=-
MNAKKGLKTLCRRIIFDLSISDILQSLGFFMHETQGMKEHAEQMALQWFLV